jgi:hypothetical protein
MKTTYRSLSFGLLTLSAVVLAQMSATGQELPAPGPEHKALQRQEGEWTATVKTEGVEGTSTGTMKCKLECGGLWLATEYRGEFWGQPFEGRGFDGYDPVKKKYVSVWVDSMSTRPLLLEGDLDEAKKTLTMVGESVGPDGQPVKFKSVTRMVDDDHHTFVMYMVGPDGAETKLMTIDYARKK